MSTSHVDRMNYAPLNEELAGPVSMHAPTRLLERISSMDVLRGLALLGILVLNIDDFGTVEFAHDIPLGTPFNTFGGPHASINFALLVVKWTFFEGKMRGLFSMLFGAGVILLTSRAESRGSKDVADVYTRRNLLLVFFGFLHYCLIWNGDILFLYGLMGLLFLYPLRKWSAKSLLWGGTILSLTLGTYGASRFTHALDDLILNHKVIAIQAQQKAGTALTHEQKDQLHEWQARVDSNHMTPEKTQKALQEEVSASYLDQVSDRLLAIQRINTIFFWDSVSAMMIGMGLMKVGFFTLELSYTSYWLTAIIGFAISIPIYVVGSFKAYASGFYFLDLDKWFWLPYYVTREPGSLAFAAVALICVKAGFLKTPQRLLAAVGRTAFSNYILTSLICQTIFLWGPWKLYGKLEYYQLMYVVFGIWAVNLILSPIWLRFFAFGPLEWLWRSLTYGKMQPMRLQSQR